MAGADTLRHANWLIDQDHQNQELEGSTLHVHGLPPSNDMMGVLAAWKTRVAVVWMTNCNKQPCPRCRDRFCQMGGSWQRSLQLGMGFVLWRRHVIIQAMLFPLILVPLTSDTPVQRGGDYPMERVLLLNMRRIFAGQALRPVRYSCLNSYHFCIIKSTETFMSKLS